MRRTHVEHDAGRVGAIGIESGTVIVRALMALVGMSLVATGMGLMIVGVGVPMLILGLALFIAAIRRRANTPRD